MIQVFDTQVLMYITGYTTTSSYYPTNGSNGFDYDNIKLYSGAYGSGLLANTAMLHRINIVRG